LLTKVNTVIATQAQEALERQHMTQELAEIKCEVRDVKALVLTHDRELAVLKDWRESAKSAIETNRSVGVDLRIQLAKALATGGGAGVGIGAVVAIVVAAFKAMGVM